MVCNNPSFSKAMARINCSVRGTVRGTHTGTPFYGVGASGEHIEINGTAILRMRDGKIVEHWGGPHCQDGLGLIR